MSDPTISGGREDGRHRRSQRSRERILEAIVDALSEGGFVPRPEAIAARAGVSVSTVFRLFGGREALADAIGERVGQRALAHVADTHEGPFLQRVASLVGSLAGGFETMRPFLGFAARNGYAERRAAALADADRFVRAELVRALGPELEGADADEIEILALLLSPDTWSRLRTTGGHTPDAAAAWLERAVVRIVTRA